MLEIPQNPNGQASSANSAPAVLSSEQEAILVASNTLTGAITETAPASDTASSGLNGRLQRVAQRITSLIGLFPSSLGQKARAGSLAATLSSEDIVALTPPAAITGFALETTQSTQSSRIGDLTETAPVSDIASSGLNGRLQRIAQRITSLITAIGNPFQAGGSIGNTAFSTNGTVFTFSGNAINSSVAQLAAGNTFTGVVENVVNNQSYSILYFSDQNATLTFNQFIDAAGLKLAQQLTFTYVANSRFARSGVMNGNYFQVIDQNTGGSTTTTRQLDTAYGTIPSATQLNNAPTAINEINGTAVSVNTGTKDAGTQRWTLATDDALNTSNTAIQSGLGAINDSAATTDTGTFSLIALFKRLLQKIVTGAGAAANAQLVTQSTETATGSITTQNLVPNGAATANSAVEITLNGASSLSIQTTGTYTGALSIQLTNDNARWETVTATSIVNAITGAYSATITSAAIGIFQFECGGFTKARITGLAAMTGTATITLRATNSTSLVTIDSALPAGSAIIGSVSQNGTWTTQIGNTPNTVPILANPLVPVAANTGDTGAKTATGNGATLTNTTGKGISATINLGVVTGTTPTAVFKIQYSNDAGTTWLDLPNATTATIVTTGVFGITVYPSITAAAGTPTSGSVALVNSVMPRTWRFVWTIGGTTPSFTITNIQVTYLL